jgi:ribosome-associated protein
MDTSALIKELTFKAVRSSGPGGQHVNKTASKVAVSFTIASSALFSIKQKERLLEKLQHRVSAEGILTVTCSESRSQHRNKALGIERLMILLQKSLRVPKFRKKTRPSRNALEKRITSKKTHALKKANRKPPAIE